MLLSNKADNRRGRSAGNGSYWMSYSDMMAALLLMFILLLFVSFNRYFTLQETKQQELEEKEQALQIQTTELEQAREDLRIQTEELATVRSLLNTKQLELDQQQQVLDDQTVQLEASQEELEQSMAQLILQQAQIDEQTRLLNLKQEDIDTLKAQLDEYSAELENRQILLDAQTAALLIEQTKTSDLQTLLQQREDELDRQAVRIEELVGVRARIIEQLRDSLSLTGLDVSIDERTGSITMNSTVFFDSDKATLKEEGKVYLASVLPAYFEALLSSENLPYVSEIIIEGHTDSDGTYAHNLDLSQRRAQAVVNFCLSSEFTGITAEQKELLRSIITANGRSWSQVIYDENGIENKQASRRVEIKFRLNDAETIEGLRQIFLRDEENESS